MPTRRSPNGAAHTPPQPGRDRPEWPVAINWNAWSQSIGITGRNQPECALDRGGMRRTWLRGRENVHKLYLIHVAGHNLGLLMRHLIGAGTPKEAAARGRLLLFIVCTEDILAVIFLAAAEPGGEDNGGFFIFAITPEPA